MKSAAIVLIVLGVVMLTALLNTTSEANAGCQSVDILRQILLRRLFDCPGSDGKPA